MVGLRGTVAFWGLGTGAWVQFLKEGYQLRAPYYILKSKLLNNL